MTNSQTSLMATLEFSSLRPHQGETDPLSHLTTLRSLPIPDFSVFGLDTLVLDGREKHELVTPNPITESYSCIEDALEGARLRSEHILEGASLVYISGADLENIDKSNVSLQFCNGACCSSRIRYARLASPSTRQGSHSVSSGCSSPVSQGGRRDTAQLSWHQENPWPRTLPSQQDNCLGLTSSQGFSFFGSRWSNLLPDN